MSRRSTTASGSVMGGVAAEGNTSRRLGAGEPGRGWSKLRFDVKVPCGFDLLRVRRADGPEPTKQERLLQAIEPGEPDRRSDAQPRCLPVGEGHIARSARAAEVTTATTASIPSSHRIRTGRTLDALPSVNGISA